MQIYQMPCDTIEPGERRVIEASFQSPAVLHSLTLSNDAIRRRDAEIERLSSVETMLHELEGQGIRAQLGAELAADVLARTSHSERRRARRERRRRRRLGAFLVVESVVLDNRLEVLSCRLPAGMLTKHDDVPHRGLLLDGCPSASVLRVMVCNTGTWRSAPFRAWALVTLGMLASRSMQGEG